jgi:hypothetical protein
MSAAATPAPATSAGAEKKSLLRWIAGGATATAVAVAIAIAVWPASETDKAYDDGQAFGDAVVQLQNATNTDEVNAALDDMSAAVSQTRDNAGDAVANQVADQQDALSRAADGFVGSRTSDDAFSVDIYQSELNGAVDDLASNADDFRTTGPEVQQAFWDGYQDALNG